MNDSLKEIIKEVIKDFFIITVAMLFVVSLATVSYTHLTLPTKLEV